MPPRRTLADEGVIDSDAVVINPIFSGVGGGARASTATASAGAGAGVRSTVKSAAAPASSVRVPVAGSPGSPAKPLGADDDDDGGQGLDQLQAKLNDKSRFMLCIRIQNKWNELRFDSKAILYLAFINSTFLYGFCLFAIIVGVLQDVSVLLEQVIAYALVLVSATTFMLVFVFHGILFENRWTLIAYLIAAYALLLRVAYFWLTGMYVDATHVLPDFFALSLGAAAMTFVMIAALIPSTIYFRRAYKDFGWNAFRYVGVNVHRQGLYRNYQLFTTLVIGDVFFTSSLIILGNFFVFNNRNDPNLYINFVALAFEIGWAIVAFWGVRKESRVVFVLVLLSSFVFPAYIIYKLYDLWIAASDTRFLFLITGVLSVAVRVLMIIASVIVYRGYGPEGLRRHVFEKERFAAELQREAAEQTANRSQSVVDVLAEDDAVVDKIL